MAVVLHERVRAALAPPSYLALPLSGIDVSTSGVKAVRLVERAHGLVLGAFSQVRLENGAVTDGEIQNRAAVAAAVEEAVRQTGITSANAALPETKSYLFEANVQGETKNEWRLAIEQRLDEYIPLSAADAAFDVVEVGSAAAGVHRVAGVGFAHRIVDESLAVFDDAHLLVRSLESETFAMARALLPYGDTSTAMIIDVGKTTTKLAVVEGRIPRFATTIGIGGHAFTLAVQKHFGVTEAEARKVKAERGIVPASGNEDYLAAMLSTVSAIKDEISTRLQYWQERVARSEAHELVSRVIIAGGNASVRGLPEYLEGALGIPVSAGDVFTNLASRDTWIPPIDYTESLAYATAIGLALRDQTLFV